MPLPCLVLVLPQVNPLRDSVSLSVAGAKDEVIFTIPPNSTLRGSRGISERDGISTLPAWAGMEKLTFPL